jgi:molybdopterin-containing oxidoreductase family iron-sulfur binding subunit
MDKCTFCVHRIVTGREKASADGREIEDGEIVPACVQACPTEAIVFGDLSNPDSNVSKMARNDRAFRELEELGTEPRVTYLKGGKTYGS